MAAPAAALALGLTDLQIHQARAVKPVRHLFSHVEWQMTGWQINGSASRLPEDYILATAAELAHEKPLPAAFRGFLPALPARFQRK